MRARRRRPPDPREPRPGGVLMAPHDGLRVSLTLQGVHPPDELFTIARIADETGFFGLWLTDSSLHSRDCWTLLGALALRTERIHLGTAVTHPRTRHPALAAVCAATLDELSGGRAILGVGAGDRPVTELGRRPGPDRRGRGDDLALPGAAARRVGRRRPAVHRARRLPPPGGLARPAGVDRGQRPAHARPGRPRRRRRAGPGGHLRRVRRERARRGGPRPPSRSAAPPPRSP